jgi:lipopolysaccharide transport system permease protein
MAKDFKIKYKHTLLGYLWAVAYPLIFAAILYIAFKNIVRIKVDNYGMFLIVGIFPWQWFANSSYLSARTLILNASIIKKIRFPKSMLPLSTVLIEMLHFLISWIVIIFFLFINNQDTFYWSWIYGFPLITFIQLVLMFGFGLAVSSLNVFFRDTERIVTLLITMLFYLTPVIYPLNMVPQSFRLFLLLNPLTGVVELWRAIFLEGSLSWEWLCFTTGYAFLALFLGSVIFMSLKGRFAEVL